MRLRQLAAAAVLLWIYSFHCLADEPAFSPAVEPKKHEKKETFAGYAKQKKAFRELCEKIEADGRREFMYKLLSADVSASDPCRACRLLLRTFSSACKPKRQLIMKNKGQEGRPEAEKQPDPPASVSPAVAESAGALSLLLAEDDNLYRPSIAAVERLLKLLRSADGGDETERAYAASLAVPIEEPFALYRSIEGYAKQARAFCYYAGLDSRKDVVFSAIKDEIAADKNCSAAKPLLQLFLPCQPAPSPKKKQPEANSVAESAGASLPDREVLESLSLFSQRLADNEKVVDKAVCAVEKLSRLFSAQGPYGDALSESLRYPFRHYLILTGHKDAFKVVCRSIRVDGRQSDLEKILTKSIKIDRDLPAFRPLLMSFLEGCRLAAIENSPEAKTKQFLPRLAVLNAVSDAFIKLSGLGENSTDLSLAAERLAAILRNNGKENAAARPYFDIFAEYMLAPFPKNKQHAPGKGAPAAEPPPKNANVEELFDF